MPEVYASRKSIRLPGFDYSAPGDYFVTVCAVGNRCIFGDVVGQEMVRNELGEIVADEWLRLKSFRSYLDLDEWIVMPNHFHGILSLLCREDWDRAEARWTTGLRPHSVSSLLAQFKSRVTKRASALGHGPVWQRNYFERIIRNERELETLRESIRYNPVEWARSRRML